MNKTDLIEKAVAEVGLAKKDVEAVVDAVLGAAGKALLAGEEVKVSGVGTFTVKKRAARKGTNPSTGAVISIPAAKAVVFKPSKTLKAKFN